MSAVNDDDFTLFETGSDQLNAVVEFSELDIAAGNYIIFIDDHNIDIFAVTENRSGRNGRHLNTFAGNECRNQTVRDQLEIRVAEISPDTPDDILSFYGEERKEKINLTPNEKEICALLLDGERHIEYICEKLGKQIYEISPIISILEIKGVLSKMGSNVYGLMNTDLED